MLTCRQPTPLPCRKGRRRCKGHGGGQLKREAVGRGIETPGSVSRAKTKRKDGGWSLKTKQNIVNSTEGRGRGARTSTRMQHTRGVLSTPGPSGTSHLVGRGLWATTVGTPRSVDVPGSCPGVERGRAPSPEPWRWPGGPHLLQLHADLVEGSQPVGFGSCFGVLHLLFCWLPASTHTPCHLPARHRGGGAAPTPPAGLRLRFGDPDGP